MTSTINTDKESFTTLFILVQYHYFKIIFIHNFYSIYKINYVSSYNLVDLIVKLSYNPNLDSKHEINRENETLCLF